MSPSLLPSPPPPPVSPWCVRREGSVGGPGVQTEGDASPAGHVVQRGRTSAGLRWFQDTAQEWARCLSVGWSRLTWTWLINLTSWLDPNFMKYSPVAHSGRIEYQKILYCGLRSSRFYSLWLTLGQIRDVVQMMSTFSHLVDCWILTLD